MVHNFSKYLLVFTVAGLVTACKKSETGLPGPAPETKILSYNFPAYNPGVIISAGSKKIDVLFASSVLSGNGLIAEFQLSPSTTATVDGVIQTSGVSANDFGREIYYQVKADGSATTNTWKVVATNNNYSYPWGLGHFIKQEKSNDRSYEWYYDQGITGVYSSVNCGPCAATSGIKWADASFSHPPEYARNFYRTNGGPWFTSDISGYLNNNAIPNAIIPLGNNPSETWNRISRQLDYGRVVILCLDANFINAASSTPGYRVDKFYSTPDNFGHFIVVKGYRELDNEKFYEVYDPYSFGQKNADDGTLKGRGRYYRYADIYTATSRWWNFAITINPKGMAIDPATLRGEVDPATIPHARGY